MVRQEASMCCITHSTPSLKLYKTLIQINFHVYVYQLKRVVREDKRFVGRKILVYRMHVNYNHSDCDVYEAEKLSK